MADAPPYFPFYHRDFTSDCKVEAMTTQEVGAYILLLCKAWQEEPPGSIPNDDAILARYARLDLTVWTECRTRVLAPFTLGTDNRWHQKRMRSEYSNAMKVIKGRSEGGKKGARIRWNNGLPIRSPNGLPNGSVITHPMGSEYGSDSNTSSFREGGCRGETAPLRVISPGDSCLPGDNPDLVPTAKRVEKHYLEAVKPVCTTSAAAIQSIIGLLKIGRDEAALKRSADGYAAWCKQNNAKGKFSTANFYASQGTWEQFIDHKPPKRIEDMTDEERYRQMKEVEARFTNPNYRAQG